MTSTNRTLLKLSPAEVELAARKLLAARLAAIRHKWRAASKDATYSAPAAYDGPPQELNAVYSNLPVMFECVLPMPVEIKAKQLPEELRIQYICGYYRWREWILRAEGVRRGSGGRYFGGSHKSDYEHKTESPVRGKIEDCVFPDPLRTAWLNKRDSAVLSSDQPVWWEQIGMTEDSCG